MSQGSRGPRLLRLGCLVALLLALGCAGCGGLLTRGVGWWFQRQPATRQALALVQEDPDVGLLLGMPVRAGWRAWGHAGDEDVDINVILEGTTRSGRLHLVARLAGERWDYTTLEVRAGGDRVDLLAWMQAQRERADEAEALELLPQADALVGQGRHDEAIPLYTQALERAPDSTRARRGRARALYEIGDLDGAEVDLLHAIGSDPDDVEARSQLGQVQRAEGEYAACIETFTGLLKRDATQADAWYQRALCYEAQGQHRQAQAGAREACARGSEDGCRMAR